MITKTKTLFAVVAIALFSCNNEAPKEGVKTDNAQASEPASKDYYFEYTLDGKPMKVEAADIMCTHRATDKDTVFSIHAGKEEGVTLLLTVPQDMTKPSVTPSGSSDYAMNITQGSASLQNYPEKNLTSNSYSTTYADKTPVIPQSIVITSTEKDGDKARIITGTFDTKTYSDESGTDPKRTEHVIKGKFRIRHEFSSMNGGDF
jgi:hypothetical protein